jgi:hypothetical protein
MPRTIKRSPKKAQDTYVKTHDHAVEEHGECQRAHRTAFAALLSTHATIGQVDG